LTALKSHKKCFEKGEMSGYPLRGGVVGRWGGRRKEKWAESGAPRLIIRRKGGGPSEVHVDDESRPACELVGVRMQ